MSFHKAFPSEPHNLSFYLLTGTSDLINLHIEVYNYGEEAHECMLYAQLPSDVYFEKYTTNGTAATDISCTTGGTRFDPCTGGCNKIRFN